MIRRGFWLLTGAALGVTGYRRVTRLARVLTGPRAGGTRSLPGTGPTPRPRLLPSAGRRALPAGVLPAPGHGTRSQVARAIAAAAFVRDVRDGMAEYRELHRGGPDPAHRGRTLEHRALEDRTLKDQSDRTLSGEPALSSEHALSSEQALSSGQAGSGKSRQGRRAP